MMKHRRRRLSQFSTGACANAGIGVLQLPCLSSAVVSQPRVVVALVEVLEDAGENFGLLVWEVNAFACRLEGESRPWRIRVRCLGCTVRGEEGRCAEDGFVGGEEAVFGAHAEHYYWTCWGCSGGRVSAWINDLVVQMMVMMKCRRRWRWRYMGMDLRYVWGFVESSTLLKSSSLTPN